MHTPARRSVVRGQYGAGFVEGERGPGVPGGGRGSRRGRDRDLRRPKVYVDNWRWAETPFYVRAGKRLARRETTIAIQFQRAPHPPFEQYV